MSAGGEVVEAAAGPAAAGRPPPVTFQRLRTVLVPGVLAAAVLGAGVLLVLASLRRPELPTFAPMALSPAEVGASLAGPLTYTVDAASREAWRAFDFSRGSVVDRPGPLEWDLAFRRHHILANGGPGFAGKGGILDLGAQPFDCVYAVPEAGYMPNRGGRDTLNPAIARWYDYGFFTHLLTPRRHVYAVRTADGRYAKLEILGYYCPGAVAGCLTFRYAYQGDGTTRVADRACDPDAGAARPPRSW